MMICQNDMHTDSVTIASDDGDRPYIPIGDELSLSSELLKKRSHNINIFYENMNKIYTYDSH